MSSMSSWVSCARLRLHARQRGLKSAAREPPGPANNALRSQERATVMLHYELWRPEGILVLRPEGSLEASDFQKITQEVDPYIEANGKLHGVMLDAEAFPGWKDFAALVAHMKFVRDHHRKIEKI